VTLSLDRSDWQKVKFGDVVRQVKESTDPVADGVKRYVAGEHMDSDSLAITRWGMVGEGYLGPAFHRKFKSGQVLYGSRRTYLRKVALADFDGVCANTTFVMESADTSRLLPELLPFVMSTEAFHAHSIAESKGSVNPYVNWPDIAKYEFELPPLDEQRRIAGLLWAVEKHMRSLVGVNSTSDLAVHAWLDIAWSSIKLCPIGQIGECVTGATPSRRSAEHWSRAEVPFYTPSEMAGVVMSPAKQGVTRQAAARARQIPENSVAVACIGGDMGKSAVVTVAGITNQQITAVTGLSEADAFLLQALLAHPRGRAATHQRETTTIVRKLNKSDLMKVEVPWPDDRDRMRDLVSRARQATLRISAEYECLVALRTAILSEVVGS